MKVWEALFCSNIYESAYATISIHTTKAGALKAIREHKALEERKKFKQWLVRKNNIITP